VLDLHLAGAEVLGGLRPVPVTGPDAEQRSDEPARRSQAAFAGLT
jgi:hypothetical protein